MGPPQQVRKHEANRRSDGAESMNNASAPFRETESARMGVALDTHVETVERRGVFRPEPQVASIARGVPARQARRTTQSLSVSRTNC